MLREKYSLPCTFWVRAQKEKRSNVQKVTNPLREYLSGCRCNVVLNMDSKDHSVEVSGRNEEYGIGQRRKCYYSNKVAKCVAELCLFCSVLWRVESQKHRI
jgi:hypothetical protein